MLKTKRPVVVIGPEYSQLSSACYDAQRQNDRKQLAESRAKLLTTVFGDQIKPGAECALSGATQCNFGSYAGSNELSANVTWLPEDDFLRVNADVTDRFFAPSGVDEAPEQGSSLQVFICPSGASYDINAITIVPSGAGGKARVIFACGEYGPSSADKQDCATRAQAVLAAWKRTGKGYNLDVKIPWSVVRGYYTGWKLMPVDAAINTWTPDGRSQIIMNRLGDPATEPFVYAALKAR